MLTATAARTLAKPVEVVAHDLDPMSWARVEVALTLDPPMTLAARWRARALMRELDQALQRLDRTPVDRGPRGRLTTPRPAGFGMRA